MFKLALIVFIVASSVASGQDPVDECPSGNYCTKFQRKLFSMPQVNPVKFGINYIESYCAGINSTMVTIHSGAENFFLEEWTQKLGVNEYLLLGARRDGSGQHQWFDGSPMNYSNWVDSYPKYWGSCIFMAFDNRWADLHCDVAFRVICQRID